MPWLNAMKNGLLATIIVFTILLATHGFITVGEWIVVNFGVVALFAYIASVLGAILGLCSMSEESK